MIMIYVDMVLLVVLCLLTVFMFGYCFYCVYRLLRSLQMSILLRPTRVLFSHTKEDGASEELRTVVAYQNPFTGDYCVHKSRLGSKGYVNSLQQSPDSGVSDEYEPLAPEPGPARALPRTPSGLSDVLQNGECVKLPTKPSIDDNSVNKTWCWHYKEYQI